MMKWNLLICVLVFVGARLQAESCGVPEDLEYSSWELVGVRCNGVESTEITDDELLNGDKVHFLLFDCDDGDRYWIVDECDMDVSLDTITSTSTKMTIDEGTATCTGTCTGVSGCNQSIGEKDYDYTIYNNGDNLDITIPSHSPFSNPCGTASGPIVFKYEFGTRQCRLPPPYISKRKVARNASYL